MMKVSCVLLLVGSVSALEAPKRHQHHLMQHLHRHHAVLQHHDHHDHHEHNEHHGQVKHEEHKPRHHLVHQQHKKPVHTHPRVQKMKHDLHQKKEAPVQFPPKIASSPAKTAAPIHHQFLASAVDRKAGLKCYEGEFAARGELNACDGGDDSACFIRYKEDASTGLRSYYRRYCTVKSACAAKDGAAYIDQAGFQSYSDGGSNVFYRCCSFEGCNSGAAAEIPGTDVGATFFLANADSGDLLQFQDGALSACSGDQCPSKDAITFNLKETGNGFSLTAADGNPADVNTAEWLVEEIGTGVFSIANGGGEAVGGFSSVKLLPASEWDTVVQGHQCPSQKQVGYKTLSDCTAACDADSECIGAVSFPTPRYGDGENLCESLLTCQCFLVTGACDEETAVENADFAVYAHRCSGVVCTALDQCHTVGVCSREDGKCSNPEMPATTACDDNDETTGKDQCQVGGTCQGEDLCKDVDCSAQGQCYNDGICDYQTGQCSVPEKEEGAQCDDNLENTVNDVCDGKGGCAGTDYCSGVDCSAQQECFEDGECDPYSGACSTPAKSKGTKCDDGNDLLVNDQCDGSGVCAGEDLCADVVCEAKDAECHEVGVCQPSDGSCTDPLSAEGTACDDGNGDTVNDQCDASGTCAGEDLCAGKSCPAASECFEEGVCQQADGSCKVEQKSEGTGCDDGNSLTDDDKCTAEGVCAGKGRCEDVTCEAIGQCHDEGECDPENGQCSAPLKSEGSRCDDGSDFTVDDRCQADATCAGTNRCADVVCDSPDVCQSAGTCDQSTGQCNYPQAADGVSCDDGDDNTVNDVCASGSCAGADLCADVTCEAASQCHEVGGCDKHTGMCGSPQKKAGTSCDDGSSVTKNDQCTDEAECVGEELCADVTCEAVDDCHDAGVCDANTGVCSNPAKAGGSACDDGDQDTAQDQCTAAGQCEGVNLCASVVCIAADQCHEAGVCDSATGSCSSVKKEEGTECDDFDMFTIEDKCTDGQCIGEESIPAAPGPDPEPCDPDCDQATNPACEPCV